MVSVHTSIYSMLMTALFYTIASLYALRTAAWLSTHALLPFLSRMLSYCYHHYRYSHLDDTKHGIQSSAPPSSSVASAVGRQVHHAISGDAASGTTIFKLVRTAAGQVLFVPVSIATKEPLELAHSLSTTTEWLMRNAMPLCYCFCLTLFGIVLSILYHHYIKAVINIARRGRRDGVNIPGLAAPRKPNSSPDDNSSALPFVTTRTKTRLNPAAPTFTPSPAHCRLLDPTVRTFTLAPALASPADSPGPATPPSVVRGVFGFAARGSGGIAADGSPLPLPFGVGKMRMVQPNDVVVGERRADEVFVFF